MVIQEDIVNKLQPRLLRQATRILNNPDYAKDMVQDVWLEVLTRDNIVDIERYCYRSVRNKAILVLKSRKYTAELDSDPGYDPYTLSDELKELVAQLPEPFQEMLELRYRCNLSSYEMAPILGYSPAHIRRKLVHARNLLVKMLEISQ